MESKSKLIPHGITFVLVAIISIILYSSIQTWLLALALFLALFSAGEGCAGARMYDDYCRNYASLRIDFVLITVLIFLYIIIFSIVNYFYKKHGRIN